MRSTNEYSCETLLGEDAFQSKTCLKKNMVANHLFNCGYSFSDRRWISCKSIEQARCGSFQCAVHRNSTDLIRSTKLDKSFDLISTGTSLNSTHECVLVVVKQHLNNLNRSLPFYALDGTSCSSDDDSLADLKFCSKNECKTNREFSDYVNCYQKAKCTDGQRCARSNRCRCDATSSSQGSKFNFTSASYCVKARSFPHPNHTDSKQQGFFDKVNFYHFLIIPCFAVVLVLASFLRSYLRTGVYKVSTDLSDDEVSVSFSGPRPQPFFCPKK